MRAKSDFDLVIVGGSFAGLSAAATAAARGLRVAVFEAKPRCGARLHTTGLLVKEAAEELDFPLHLTRKIHGVRLYAPNLKHVDMFTPGYYFLATDTGVLLDWMAARATTAGATILHDTHFTTGRIERGYVRFSQPDVSARFVIGSDGPRSQVARCFGLGLNRHFLSGIEAEFDGADVENDLMHCFLDSRIAPGYLGWAFAGVGLVQAGLAVTGGKKPDIDSFLARIGPILGVRSAPREHRGGLIPCGGLVRPFANSHVLLVGDAAGLVSPLTGGGIHRALQFGRRAALAVGDFLHDGGEHPGIAMSRLYPTLRGKRLLRLAMNFSPANRLYDAMLNRRSFLTLARSIYFNTGRRSVERTFPAAAPETKRSPVLV